MQSFYEVKREGSESFWVCGDCITNYNMDDHKIAPDVISDPGGNLLNMLGEDAPIVPEILCRDCDAKLFNPVVMR